MLKVMGTASQLVLNLQAQPALGRDDFFVSQSNMAAVRWVDNWPNWPRSVVGLNLFGPPASGKSHLASVWKSKSGAMLLDSPIKDSIFVHDLLGSYKNIIIDNFDSSWPGEPILHLYNSVLAIEGKILIVTNGPIAQMDIRPLDLASRLITLATVAIKSPDDDLIKGVMAKLFRDRQIKVANEVIDYLAVRMERSLEEVNRLVDVLDNISLAENNAVTLPLARKIINDLT
ncbi:MAG: DNA replication protein [Rhodospirillaceae bacterium]|nr:DNA replication protein [Rhodospirillaceae bacterium]